MSNMAMSFVWMLVLQAQAVSEPADAVAEVLESGQSTVPAKVVSRKAPRYPGIELAKGHEAWVRVAFCIDETGKPQNIAVLDSVGNQRFERSALNTVDDFRACEALQQQVWAMPDNLEVVPLHLLVTVQRNGGLLLGAFDGDDLVGFVFGFPGVSSNGKLKHCSHLMGVASSHRSRGVGYKLKLAQRELVLDQGIGGRNIGNGSGEVTGSNKLIGLFSFIQYPEQTARTLDDLSDGLDHNIPRRASLKIAER